MSEEKKVKTVYISGKIGGIEDIAPELFLKAENELKEKGYNVVNPMNIEHNHDKSWLSYMRNDIKALVDCDAIYMLDNWIDSRGAKVELTIAYGLDLETLFESEFEGKYVNFLNQIK